MHQGLASPNRAIATSRTTALQALPHRALPLRIMSQTSDLPPSFEAALAELEALVATMEGGQLPLAESLSAYKRGAALLAYCQTALRDAQQQVDVLEKGVLKAFKPDRDDDA